MKRNISLWLFSVITLLSLASCSQDVANERTQVTPNSYIETITDIDGTTFKTRVATGALRTLIDEYVVLENNQLHIKMSKPEALKLGITEGEYDEVCRCVEDGNKMIDELLEKCSRNPDSESVTIVNGDQTVILTDRDITAQSVNILEPKPLPHGVITTYDAQMGSMRAHAPIQMKEVYAHCYSNVALKPSQTVITDAFGGRHSKFISGNGSVTVPIAASNTDFTISYITTDSNGGRCSWRGVE